MTREDLAKVIERSKAQGLQFTILVVQKGPKWHQHGEGIRTALGVGRIVGSQARKDGKEGVDVLVEFRLEHLEAFLARWKRMAGEG